MAGEFLQQRHHPVHRVVGPGNIVWVERRRNVGYGRGNGGHVRRKVLESFDKAPCGVLLLLPPRSWRGPAVTVLSRAWAHVT